MIMMMMMIITMTIIIIIVIITIIVDIIVIIIIITLIIIIIIIIPKSTAQILLSHGRSLGAAKEHTRPQRPTRGCATTLGRSAGETEKVLHRLTCQTPMPVTYLQEIV
jgi:hypothetical protein